MGKLKFALILILVLASAANFSLFPPEDVFAGWISGWGYRKPVTITNSGSALSDYQVLVALNTSSLVSAGKMKSDCGDVRFTDSDGSTQLNYWIESGCNSADTKVWVKVPSVTAGSKIIYVYYGNPTASSASNGTATFVFFDDFSGDLSKWTRTSAQGTSAIESGELSLLANGADAYRNEGYTSTVSFLRPLILEFSERFITYPSPASTPESVVYFLGYGSFFYGNSSYGFYFPTTGTFYQQYGLVVPNTLQKNKVEVNSSNIIFTFETTTIWNVANTGITSGPILLQAGQYTSGYSTHLHFDDVRVRKYTATVPTTGAGTEEIAVLPVPTVTTQAASSVEATTAIGNGTITATDSNATRRGFAYMVGTSGDPTTGNSVSYDDGSFGIGSYTKTIAGLSPSTNYRVRAYAVNSGGTGYGTTVQILTKPNAPINISATDGAYIDKVAVTWTKSTGATAYQVYRDGVGLGWLGDIAAYDDTGAAAPTITPGTASASDGGSADYVSLSLSGQSANNGTTHIYKVVASNATGNSADSSINAGYRGVGALTYQWQRSAGDSDANYSDIIGAVGASYSDTGAPSGGEGRYYKSVMNATGATQQTSTADRGFRIPPPPCQSHTLTGWAWSENIGWISFSCANTVAIGEGIDFGVDVDEVTGLFSGYAWSENIGWISFNTADLAGCPSGTCNASFNQVTREISGWARALSYGDSWDGWIKMRN